MGATKPEEHDGQCWKDGNQNAKCTIHFSLHSGYTFVAAMISAIVLEEHITAQEKKMLDEDFTFEELLEKSPNARTFPQIFVDGELIGGYNEFEKMEWWADRT